MKLYKYISSKSALENIAKGNIKFATIGNLNDPTELLPKIYDEVILESLSKKRKFGFSQKDLKDLSEQEELFDELSPNMKVIDAPKTIQSANSIIQSPVYSNTNYLKKMLKTTVDIMASKCGIFCCSTRFDSLPMWAHYANNASGFVVEFNNLEEVYTGDKTNILNQITKVNYTSESVGITFDSGSFRSIFFEKNIDWSYEREQRIIVNIAKCKELKIETKNLYIQSISKKHISSVILGWKVDSDDAINIKKEITLINPGIEIYIADIKDGKIIKKRL